MERKPSKAQRRAGANPQGETAKAAATGDDSDDHQV